MNCDKSRELPLALIAFGISVYSRKRSNNKFCVVGGSWFATIIGGRMRVVPSTAHGDVPLQAPFFLELRSEVVRLRPLPVGDKGSNKNCRTVKICRRSKPITNFGNRWSLSPWRTNRRSLFTAPTAGESERILFPSVPSRQPTNHNL